MTEINGIYQNILNKDDTTYDKVKQFYSKKKYLLNTQEPISLKKKDVSGNSLQTDFRVSIKQNNDIIDRINGNDKYIFTNYSAFQSFIRDNIKYLNQKDIRPIHTNLLKKQILYSPTKFLQDIVTKINEKKKLRKLE